MKRGVLSPAPGHACPKRCIRHVALDHDSTPLLSSQFLSCGLLFAHRGYSNALSQFLVDHDQAMAEITDPRQEIDYLAR